VSAAPEVVVAVVSWNTRDLLARCLDSVAPHVRSGAAEAWVVDNASSDGSAALVSERYPWARLLALDENVGFGAAVNHVAERTESPWLAVANADVALRPGALDALLAAGAADPGAGAIAPRLVQPDGATQHSVFGFPTIPHTALLASGLYRLSGDLADRLAVPGHWDAGRARRVPWAVAAFLLVRRAAWRRAGGFDPQQFMYAEDLDLGWRLRAAGWMTRYEPRAVVEHVGAAATSQTYGADPSPRYWRSTYGWMARRRGVPRTWAVAALNAAGAAWRWPVAAALARPRPDPWAARRDGLAGAARMHASGLARRATLERFR
jgi:N-acetylglucosaminyl-diphospho-decaprenol L-rhamnosyltransferase